MTKKNEVEAPLGLSPDGHAVTSVAVSLNVGSGLNDAVKVQPIESPGAGDEVYIAVKAKFVRDQFDYKFNDDGSVKETTHVLVLKALAATFVDAKIVGKSIQKTIDLVAEARALEEDDQQSFHLVTDDSEVPKPGGNARRGRAKFEALADQVDAAFDGDDVA